MLLRIIIAIFVTICCCSGNAVAEKNFWNNEKCTTDADCVGLTSCDKTFGCTVSVPKVALILVCVFFTIFAIITAIVCLCVRGLTRNTQFARPHYNHRYMPQTVITTINPNAPYNPTQMATTGMTVYPHNPYPNQFYANSVNPPMYNPNEMMGNQQQIPTAPYPPAGFDQHGNVHSQQSYYHSNQ